MTRNSRSLDKVNDFITQMRSDLDAHTIAGQVPPIEKRKLRTITHDCGHIASRVFLDKLYRSLQEAGIYTEPPLDDTGIGLDDWVRFSTGPFPPDAVVFSKEKYLQRFVEDCLGTGVFRNLELYKENRRTVGREYRLPNNMHIDLLCQERTRNGYGALVAIELKRERARGTVEQLIEYIDLLKQQFPSRSVRGIIVSGREDRVGAALLRSQNSHDITWYCYHVEFERVPNDVEQ